MSGRTVIRILCENTSPHAEGLIAEHGFAALIERDGYRILFDTGQGLGLLNNAVRLGIDLRNIDAIVLSHGHWDHAGGLADVLGIRQSRTVVYAHPDVFSERYYTEQTGTLRFAGIRFPRQYLEAIGADFHLDLEPRAIGPGIWISGQIPRQTSFEETAKQLKIRADSLLTPDAVTDEQSLIVEGQTGLIVLMGCGHPGLINTINHATRITGNSRIEAVIGGTHLMFLSDEQAQASIDALKVIEPGLVGTSHCTGGKANAKFRLEFPDRFRECNVGSVLTF